MEMARLKRLMELADTYYMATACAIVGIPLAGLVVMEIIGWIWLYGINQKLAILESMF